MKCRRATPATEVSGAQDDEANLCACCSKILDEMETFDCDVCEQSMCDECLSEMVSRDDINYVKCKACAAIEDSNADQDQDDDQDRDPEEVSDAD